METSASSSFRRVLVDPVVESNPVTLQILGLCSALAVTSQLLPAIVMSAAVIAVLAFSNVAVSLLREIMPNSIRLIVEVTLVASAVIVVDEVLKAFLPGVSSVLSVFVGLIITNCIVLARVESFAMRNGPIASLLDGIGNGLGYGWVLIVVATVRELTGAGTVLGYAVLPTIAAGGWYRENELMLLTPSAFFILALLVWMIRSFRSQDAASRSVQSAAGARGQVR